ncbi:MAG: serine hydrolase [Gemmatimonadales bacterium]|nr:serine hydrolase [Gemmatimonadales bacterium]
MPVSARVVTRSRPAAVLARRLFSVLLLLAVLAPASRAQRAVDVGTLDAYFAAARSAWNVPGFAVAIVKDDAVVLARGYGLREMGKPDAVDAHTLFAIASNTKAFTAAALARLVDEGKLSWDDRVVDHLPFFELYSPYVTQEMRVRDLLSHRSGLGTYSGDLVWYGTRYSRNEVLRRLRYLPPSGSFRADYGYSNVMFLAAGQLVPAVTGRSWDEFIETEFFGPLGMDRSVTSVDSLPNRTNVATPHGERDGRLVTFPWYSWDNVGPAASIISSVSEMARWIRLQLNGGTWDARTYFTAGQSQTMWTPHMSFTVSAGAQERYPSTHFRGYGLGWGLMDYLGRKVMSHGGAADGMYSRVVLVPEERLGMVILTNSMTSLPTALSYRILDAYLGGPERDWSAEFLAADNRGAERWAARWAQWDRERVPNTTPSLALDGYTGTFGGPLYGDATVTLEDGGLVLRLLPNPDLVGDLTHWHHDTFQVVWRHEFPWFGRGWVQFVLDRTGRVVELRMDVPNEDFWFNELEFKKRD